MADFQDDAQRLHDKLLVQIMAFRESGEGDEVCNDLCIGELTDFGHGFAEIGFGYGDEQVYVRFRVADLIRATKEHGHG